MQIENLGIGKAIEPGVNFPSAALTVLCNRAYVDGLRTDLWCVNAKGMKIKGNQEEMARLNKKRWQRKCIAL